MTNLKYVNYCDLSLPVPPLSKLLVSAENSPLNCAREIANAVIATKKGMQLKSSVFVLKGAAQNFINFRPCYL